MTSITLESIGLSKEIDESGNYTSVRNALTRMNPQTQAREQRKLGAAPDFAMGSVHAVTEGGVVMIASLTGSTFPSKVLLFNREIQPGRVKLILVSETLGF